jgi:RNA polymerase sigma factor FliA
MAMLDASPNDARPEQVARADELDQLWRRWREHNDLAARNRLATLYYPLVRNIARMMVRSLAGRADLGDLESYGAEGLLGALERFDPERGFDFSSFAAYRIRYAILDGVRGADWVPRSVRDHERRLRSVEDDSYANVGRAPTRDEQAEVLGISRDELERVRTLTQRSVVTSISAVPVDDDGYGERDLVSEVFDPLAAAESAEVMELVREGLQRLPERQRTVIVLSLDGGETLAEIGRRLGVTESRACQIRTMGLRSLRSYLVERGLSA